MHRSVKVLASLLVVLATSYGHMTGPAAAHHNYGAPTVVQFNIFGGGQNNGTGTVGNATLYYNETIGYRVVDSIINRSPHHPQAISLNEVCHHNWDVIRWWVTSGGLDYSFDHTVSLGDFFGAQVGTARPTSACGSWYGSDSHHCLLASPP